MVSVRTAPGRGARKAKKHPWRGVRQPTNAPLPPKAKPITTKTRVRMPAKPRDGVKAVISKRVDPNSIPHFVDYDPKKHSGERRAGDPINLSNFTPKERKALNKLALKY